MAESKLFNCSLKKVLLSGYDIPVYFTTYLINVQQKQGECILFDKNSQQVTTQTSFPAILKVANIVILVRLLMERYFKQLRMESVSMQFYICHGTLN